MAVPLPARNWLQVARTCAVRDVRSALTERSTLIQTISLPVNYMIMMILFVLAGSHAPAAVVMHDDGPYAQQLVTALRQAHAYRLIVESEAQAQDQWRQGTLVALFTIPANFDTAVAHGQAVQIPLAVNNLNEDLTHDAEWAAREAITAFYARAFPHQVSIFPQEHDQYAQDAGYVQFLAMSVIVIALMVSGLLQAGTAAARDWEEGTIQELLLAPGRTSAVLAWPDGRRVRHIAARCCHRYRGRHLHRRRPPCPPGRGRGDIPAHPGHVRRGRHRAGDSAERPLGVCGPHPGHPGALVFPVRGVRRDRVPDRRGAQPCIRSAGPLRDSPGAIRLRRLPHRHAHAGR